MSMIYRLKDRELGFRLEAIEGFAEKLNEAAQAQMPNRLDFVIMRLHTSTRRMQFSFRKEELEYVGTRNDTWFHWPAVVPPADELLRLELLYIDRSGKEAVSGRYCGYLKGGRFFDANIGTEIEVGAAGLRFSLWERDR